MNMYTTLYTKENRMILCLFVHGFERLATFDASHVAACLPSEQQRKQIGRTMAYCFFIACTHSLSLNVSSELPQKSTRWKLNTNTAEVLCLHRIAAVQRLSTDDSIM